MGSPRLTPEQRAQVVEFARSGMTRNDIHRRTGVAAATITKLVNEAGLSFDRTSTKAATAAKKADMRARRAELAQLLLEDAHRLRAEMWEPVEYVDHGGKDFVEVRWDMPTPSIIDKLKLVQAAGAAIGKHIDLERHDTDEAAGDARSMLADLGRALGVKPADERT